MFVIELYTLCDRIIVVCYHKINKANILNPDHKNVSHKRGSCAHIGSLNPF